MIVITICMTFIPCTVTRIIKNLIIQLVNIFWYSLNKIFMIQISYFSIIYLSKNEKMAQIPHMYITTQIFPKIITFQYPIRFSVPQHLMELKVSTLNQLAKIALLWITMKSQQKPKTRDKTIESNNATAVLINFDTSRFTLWA